MFVLSQDKKEMINIHKCKRIRYTDVTLSGETHFELYMDDIRVGEYITEKAVEHVFKCLRRCYLSSSNYYTRSTSSGILSSNSQIYELPSSEDIERSLAVSEKETSSLEKTGLNRI